MKLLRGVASLCVLLLAVRCATAPPRPTPHFVLGKPYQAGRAWHYPTESYDLTETGLASILPDRKDPLTTDSELWDQRAMAAAHPTLQLPAIARITNLETGRAVVVRINDRGTGSPRRLVEVTRRVADLLGFPASGVAQVRIEILPNESHAAVDVLPDAPRLGVTAVPRDLVEVAELPPPPGTRQGGGRVVTGRTPMQAADPVAGTAVPAERLPERVEQLAVEPGYLWVRLDTFAEYQYAAIQRAKLAGLRPAIVSLRNGRTRVYRVQIGPIGSVAEADAALDQALAAGIPDARIVVE